MRKTTAATAFLFALVFVSKAAADKKAAEWELTGGPPWTGRVGPGLMASVSGNDCTDVYCLDHWNTGYFGSIGGSFGFYYRVIENLVVLAEAYIGRVKTDADWLDNDRGLLFEATGAAEFHGPIAKWADSYVGLGIGFALLSFKGEAAGGGEQSESLKGIDFEIRTGLDFYPFPRAPKLGFGAFFKLGMPWWIEGCIDAGGQNSCNRPGNLGMDDLPFLVHFGAALKFGF
jgi:hypothetical protein